MTKLLDPAMAMKQESEIQIQKKEKSNVTKDVNDTPKRQTRQWYTQNSNKFYTQNSKEFYKRC